MPKKILIVDDEKDILTLLSYHLEKEGYAVLKRERGDVVADVVRQEKPDLVILDLMLPGMNGVEICRALKSDPKTRSIPLMMLTAKGEETDIVVGLELGADDYITKPFSPKIVLARTKALLRRGQEDGGERKIQAGPVTIDPERRHVSIGGKPVELTATEFNLLKCLAARPGKVFGRDELLDLAWNQDTVVTDRTIDVHVVSLRKKMGKFGDCVETVRGFGYRFEPGEAEK